MEEARKNFETAYMGFKTAVAMLGGSPYNLLHHAQRDQKLLNLKNSFDQLKETAAAYDAAIS
jgi:hypothetical protein